MAYTSQNLIHHACDSAMHIIYQSNLEITSLWPKKGFKAGFGIGCNVKDRIYYFSRIFDFENNPNVGQLQFNIFNTPIPRFNKQFYALKLLMDHAYINDLLFVDMYPGSAVDTLRFKFTYTPQ